MSTRIEADGGTEAEKTVESDPDALECERCPHWKEIRRRLRVSKLLTTAIVKLEARFREADFKPTVGDYLKLVEMEEELEQVSQMPKEIKVTWVDPTTSSSEK
jgi:hypothetical protein